MSLRGMRAGSRGSAICSRPVTVQQAWAAGGWLVYQSDVHSHTLPIMSYRPYPLAGIHAGRRGSLIPSSRVFWTGNSPCQVLASRHGLAGAEDHGDPAEP